MDPYFVITQASDMFNLAITPAKSNGADESKNLDALSAVLTKAESERPNDMQRFMKYKKSILIRKWKN